MRFASLSAVVLTASLLAASIQIGPVQADPPTALQIAQSAPDANADGRKAQLDFWTSIKDSKKAEDYQAYLDRYPRGDFADLAKLRIKKYAIPAAATANPPPAAGTEDPRFVEIDQWNAIKDSNNIQDFYAYLDKYPDGEFADLAKDRIEQMTAAAAPAPTLLLAPPAPPAQPAPATETPLPSPPPSAPSEPSKPEEKPASVTPAPAPTEKSASEAPAPAPEEKPAAATPAPELAFKAIDAKVYAKSGGQVRAEPNSKTALLSKLKTNAEVHATGRSSDGNWWRVQIAGGKTGYMHKSVVSEKPLTAPDSKEGKDAAAAAAAVTDQDLCKPDSEAAPNARVSACERLLAKAGSDDKAKLDGLVDLATALNIAGRNDEAIRKYEQAADLAPNNAKIYYRVGRVRLDQQKFPEARTAFEKAASLDPDNPDIVFQRGLAYIGIGDFEQARLEVKRALLTKDDPVYYEKLGELELTLGDLDAAKTALERGRTADPKRHSLILLATHYFTGGRDQALGQGAVVPDDSNAALWNAILRKAGGDAEGATQILKSARIDIGKRDWPGPIFDALTGRTSVAKARAAAGLKQFQRLCKLNFFIGEMAFLSGDKEAARAALQAAVDTRAYTTLEYAAAKARLANMGG